MQTQETQANQAEEISIEDIAKFIKEEYKKILLGCICASLFGFFYLFITPPKYQATANIQVAKVANADVESPNLLVEKIKMPTYFSENTFTECKVFNLLEPGSTLAKGLKPTLAKNAPIVSISFKANSSEDAKKCLEAILSDVRTNQNEIASPILQTKKNQLSNLKQKLEAAENILKVLPSKRPNFDFSDPKFSASTLLLATTLNKENEVKDLRTQISDLEIALSEPQTKEAFLTTPIYSPNVQIEPKKSVVLLVSFLIGGFLMTIFLIIKKSLKK